MRPRGINREKSLKKKRDSTVCLELLSKTENVINPFPDEKIWETELTFTSIYTHFDTLKKKSFRKTLWKTVKLLKISNFTFFQDVFYAICILKSYYNYISYMYFIDFLTSLYTFQTCREEILSTYNNSNTQLNVFFMIDAIIGRILNKHNFFQA